MTYFSENSKSIDFPLVTDELEYSDPLIPMKLHVAYLPNSLLTSFVIESSTAEESELFDNAAELYDSVKYDEEIELLGRPEAAQNFRFEKVEKNPCVLHDRFFFGKGETTFKNGLKYTGDMNFSLMHGRGIIQGENMKYTGTFRNNEIEGDGRYEWKNSVYDGEIRRGTRNGDGVLNFVNGVAYNGQWREGLREGYGKVTFPNGQSYEGYWEKGKKHGYGVLKFSSGNVYEGNFQNDKMCGQGTMFWNTRKEKYTGEWKDSLPHGYGIHIWLDSKGNKLLRNRYVGQWAFGKRNGQGTFYYANGSKYEGNWVDDLKSGQGIMTFEDGSIYSGAFENDHMVDRTLSGQVEVRTATSPVVAQANTTTAANNTTKKSILKNNPKDKNAKDAQVAQKKSPDGGMFASKRSKRQVEANPFKNLLDITDITIFEDDEEKAEKEVQNLLLKHNSNMMMWYRRYSTLQESKEKEESFTMVMKQFWRFLRDARIISYKLPIAHVNRLFIQGSKNSFKIAGSNVEAGTTVEQSYINKSSRPFTPAVPPNLDISNIVSQADPETLSDEEEALIELELDDVHSTDRPILIRQFMEALVRVAFLKYSNGGKLHLENAKINIKEGQVYVERPQSQIGCALYKLFTERLEPFAGNKTCKTIEEDIDIEEGLSAIQSNVAEELFLRYAKTDKGLISRKDITIEIKSLVQLLKDSHVIPKYKSFEEILEIVERYHDPEYSYTELIKEKSEKVKTRVLMKLLGSELTEYEFYEIIVLIGLSMVERTEFMESEESEDSYARDRVEKFFNEILIPGFGIKAEPEVSEEGEKPKIQRKKPSLSKYKISYPKTPKQKTIEENIRKKKEEEERERKENEHMEKEDVNINLS